MLIDPTKPQEPCFGADMIPSCKFPWHEEQPEPPAQTGPKPCEKDDPKT